MVNKKYKISKDDVLRGVKDGVIAFVEEPSGFGTVCQIGEHWFYFGGETAEVEPPEMYLANSSMEENVRMIYDTLCGFYDYGFDDEYGYYAAILKESE